MASERLSAALSYARRGWAVFPLNGKKPYLGTHGFHDASTKLKVIRAWWREHPEANVGIRCDSQTGPIVVDVDGPDGKDFLHEIRVQYGRLPRTLEATSGRKYRKHLYFAPDGKEVARHIKINKRKLDILGDGGYVVAPPSIHPKTGKPYRWLNDREMATFPAIFREIIEKKSKGAAPPLPEVIDEGERDVLLTSLAGSMRRRGASEEAILAALREENDLRCDPPMPDRQLEKIARSIAKKAPVPIDLTEPLNDINLARRFAKVESAGLRYCRSWKKWLIWDGRRWSRDETGEAARRVEAMVRGLYEIILGMAGEERDKFLKDLSRYTQRRKLEDILSLASHAQNLVITAAQLDQDAWLFNVENGTLDLRTGTLKEHDPNDLISKLAPVVYDPEAEYQKWGGFLSYIMGEDAGLTRYLQRAVGYTLAGVTSEHTLFFGHGSGANGKTTFLETIRELFGDYATTIDFETLLHQRYGGGEAQRDLPRLHKARFVLADEAPTTARWDERAVKKLTGGNTLSGRWLYQEKFDFTPTHTLWCQANDRPSTYDPSEAFWRRMRLIPFEVRIPKKFQVPDYKLQLFEELPGILNWALEGLREWEAAVEERSPNALGEPKTIQKATKKYREETDSIGEFIDARCILDPRAWTSTSDLYRELTEWWRDTRGAKSPPINRYSFGNALEKRSGLRPSKRGGVRGWKGVAINTEVEI